MMRCGRVAVQEAGEAAGDRGAKAQRAEKGSTADWGQGSTGTANEARG